MQKSQSARTHAKEPVSNTVLIAVELLVTTLKVCIITGARVHPSSLCPRPLTPETVCGGCAAEDGIPSTSAVESLPWSMFIWSRLWCPSASAARSAGMPEGCPSACAGTPHHAPHVKDKDLHAFRWPSECAYTPQAKGAGLACYRPRVQGPQALLPCARLAVLAALPQCHGMRDEDRKGLGLCQVAQPTTRPTTHLDVKGRTFFVPICVVNGLVHWCCHVLITAVMHDWWKDAHALLSCTCTGAWAHGR